MRRVRRAPKKLAEVSCEEWIPATPKYFISQSFNEVIGLVKNLISSRFSQEGFKLVCNIETLLTKACEGTVYLSCIPVEYYERYDISEGQLRIELKLIRSLEFSSVSSVIDILKKYRPCHASMLPDVIKLLKLVLPGSNAERSISGLSRLQTYLRTSMTQRKLNDWLLLHVHNEGADSIDEREVVRQFVSSHYRRSALIKL